MVYNNGLSVAQRRDFEQLLVTHHTIDVQLNLLDLNMNELPGGNISKRLLDGQVTFDADSEITRGLDLDLLDPTGALHLDSKSPDAGAMFADRMIRVRYSIINPMGTLRYTYPIFTGPITKLDRSGAAIHVECHGKECLGLAEAWNEKTYKKGLRVTSVIASILDDIMGETHMSIPNLAAKLPRNVSVGGDKLPWPTAKALASSIGYQLFYDGMGVARMRKLPSGGAMFTFAEGKGGSVKTEPQVGFSIENVVNAVEVLGKKPKKKKGKTTPKRPRARVIADNSHPLSPWALGRKGGPRYLPKKIEDDSVTTDAQAKARAKKILASGLLESVEVAFDTLTIPHLEELDVVKINTEKYAGNFRLRKHAVPLTAAAQMSVGYVRNVKPNKSAIRARR